MRALYLHACMAQARRNQAGSSIDRDLCAHVRVPAVAWIDRSARRRGNALAMIAGRAEAAYVSSDVYIAHDSIMARGAYTHARSLMHRAHHARKLLDQGLRGYVCVQGARRR